MGPGDKDEASKGPLADRRLLVNAATLVAIGIIHQEKTVADVDADYQENSQADRNVRTCSIYADNPSYHGSARTP